MVRFEPTWEELELYKDGGIAIIDQWICAHARCLPPCSPGGSGSFLRFLLPQYSAAEQVAVADHLLWPRFAL